MVTKEHSFCRFHKHTFPRILQRRFPPMSLCYCNSMFLCALLVWLRLITTYKHFLLQDLTIDLCICLTRPHISVYTADTAEYPHRASADKHKSLVSCTIFRVILLYTSCPDWTFRGSTNSCKEQSKAIGSCIHFQK